MTMDLWMIQRDERDVGYDEAAGFVVIAANPAGARDLAARNCGDEGPDTWHDRRLVVFRVGTNPDADEADVQVLLRDFRNG